MWHVNRAMLLAPHTDDGEFGCGGLLARLVEQNVTVYYVVFSICEESVPQGFPSDILETEVKKATQVLGINSENLIIHRYPVRRFPQYRQEILENLVQLRREINPDLVLTPSTDDIHQDHQVVAAESLRAFKHTTILGYEMPWNNLTFQNSVFVKLEKRHIEKKVRAVQQYQSQNHRNYAEDRIFWSLAEVRGTQAAADYAEAFQLIRWMID